MQAAILVDQQRTHEEAVLGHRCVQWRCSAASTLAKRVTKRWYREARSSRSHPKLDQALRGIVAGQRWPRRRRPWRASRLRRAARAALCESNSGCANTLAEISPKPRQINSSRIALRSAARIGGTTITVQRPDHARIRFAVDALGRLCESVAAVVRQPIFAELAGAASLEPAVLRQPRGRGAHQAFIQAERRRQCDQAAESDGPATRHDGIAEQRHDQRTAAQRPLPAKSSHQLGGGSEGNGSVFGHVRSVLKAHLYDT